MPSTPTFELYKGDSLDVDLSITSEDCTPIDLSIYTVSFSLNYRTSGVIWTKLSTTPSDILITDAPNGKCTIFFKPTNTNTLNNGNTYLFIGTLTDNDNNVYTVLQGILKLL